MPREAEKMDQKKSPKIQASVEEIRSDMVSAGLFICDAKHPWTGMFCWKVYFESNKLEEHQCKSEEDNNLHDFPTNENATDFVLQKLSEFGGIVKAGACPDQQSDTLFQKVVASDDGSAGGKEARCHGGFN